MPKLSIIIPIYNVEEYIRECLDSVKDQTFTDFEVLLIDDGSPDGCGAICDEYAAKDSRFKVWHKENGGVSSARNLGLDNAKGEWITFIDPDDYLLSNNVYEEIIGQAKNGDYDLIRFGHKANEIDILPSTSGICKKILAKEDILEHITAFFQVWSVWIKREKINNHRFINIKTSEDVLFIQKLLLDKEIKSLLIIDKAYVYYRVSTDSATNIFQSSFLQDKITVMSELRKYIFTNKIEFDECNFKDIQIMYFFEALGKFAKHRDAKYLAKTMKEFAPQLNIHKNLTWSDTFINGKPYITYILVKLKLYKLASLYIKRKN